jgi:uncharacterized protein YjiS (DUF1127 family)
MTTVAHPVRPWRASDVAPLGWLPPLLSQWRRRRHAAATARELKVLDARMLRDVGLSRSEIGSLSAEVAGLTERSRVRARQADLA